MRPTHSDPDGLAGVTPGEQTDLLRLGQVITAAANEAAEVADALLIALDEVCRYTEWPIGHAWAVDGMTGELVSTGLWHIDDARACEGFVAESERSRFAPGIGLPGRVLASGKPAGIEDVTADENFPRAPMAAAIGLRGAFAFPVLVGREVVGVLEFFALEQAAPRSALLEIMLQIGTQLGRAIERDRAQRRLRESEERFRALAESASDAIVSMSSDGAIVSWNRGARTIFGYAADEVIGESLLMLMPREYRDSHEAALARVNAGGEQRIIGTTRELEGLRKDGERFPLELSVSTWKQGGRSFYTGIIRDITERRRAERSLRQGEQRHALAMRAATEGIYEWNVATDGLFLTERAKSIFGLIGDELTAESWNRRVHPEDFPRYREAIVEHFNGRAEHMECEYRFRGRSGDYIWLSDRGIAVRDSTGRAVRMVGAFSDITQRKADEQAVREQSEYLALLQAITSAANESLAAERALHTALREVCEITTWPLGHVYLKTDDTSGAMISTRIWHIRDEQRFRTFRDRTEGRRGGVSGTGLIGRVLAGGRPAWIEDVGHDESFVRADEAAEAGIKAAFAFPVLIGSEVVAILEFFDTRRAALDQSLLDLMAQIGIQLGRVVERARAQAELRRAKELAEAATGAKSQFLASMSHELRTPLNAIIGVSEMLQEEAGDFGYDNFTEPLGRVVGAGRHLLALIDEILDLSKIEAGKMELHLGDFDIGAVVREAVATVKPAADKNDNRLSVACAGDLGEMHADLTRVRQILMNLLSNACKFTERGDIRVEALRVHAVDGDWIELVVADTGIGMSDDQLERLFLEFSQAHTENAARYGGAGLGLAISRRFCHLMGGDIAVESAPGEGSRFTVRIPAAVSAQTPAA